MPGVSIIILAAGGSSRLGRPKQSVLFRGETLLRGAAKTALAADAGSVVVVLGAGAEQLQNSLADLPVNIAFNSRWQLGLGTSIATGIHFLETHGGPDAALLMACDQPLVTPELLNRLIFGFKFFGTPIATAQCGDMVDVPALFSRPYFFKLAALCDDEGARKIIAANLDSVTLVPFPDAMMDVDTEDDVRQLAQAARGSFTFGRGLVRVPDMPEPISRRRRQAVCS